MKKILDKLRHYNIKIDAVGDKLKLKLPEGFEEEELLDLVRLYKQEILDYLKTRGKETANHNSSVETFTPPMVRSWPKEQEYFDIFFQQEKEYLSFLITGKGQFILTFSVRFEHSGRSSLPRW